MELTVRLGDYDYKLRSSLFTIISYRNVFGTELFSDVAVLDKLKNKNEEEIFRITYILHKPFTSKSYDEFLNELDFAIIGDVKALEELANVIGKLLGTIKKPNTP